MTAHQIRLHLLNRIIRDWQPEMLLRNRKVQPQLSPSEEPVLYSIPIKKIKEMSPAQ
jgi:hypothetical protein